MVFAVLAGDQFLQLGNEKCPVFDVVISKSE
jgi:hypothetical protein